MSSDAVSAAIARSAREPGGRGSSSDARDRPMVQRLAVVSADAHGGMITAAATSSKVGMMSTCCGRHTDVTR